MLILIPVVLHIIRKRFVLYYENSKYSNLILYIAHKYGLQGLISPEKDVLSLARPFAYIYPTAKKNRENLLLLN